jgi:hypothetical protein
MSKRKHEPEANDRNVRKKTEEINILPAVDEAETVPVAFKYEEVVVNPESSRTFLPVYRADIASHSPPRQKDEEKEES